MDLRARVQFALADTSGPPFTIQTDERTIDLLWGGLYMMTDSEVLPV